MRDDRAVQLVGRDPEFRHVRAAMERVRAGNAAVTVVEGEPGIGTTRLVRDVESVARSEGWHVVEFRCAELDADRPFEAVASGLEELDGHRFRSLRILLLRRPWPRHSAH